MQLIPRTSDGHLALQPLATVRAQDRRLVTRAIVAILLVTAIVLTIVAGINYGVDNHGLLTDHLDSKSLRNYGLFE